MDGEREDKAGSVFEEDKCVLTVKENPLKYVSRGGLKLEKAMQCFPISLAGTVCMDIGASTGGFTDCMLQNGAAKVYSVDVGHGQLAWKLRNDERVVCMEKPISVTWFPEIFRTGWISLLWMFPLFLLLK